jgi:hypothetical protein
MSAGTARPAWRRWTVIVPLATLAIVGAALLLDEPRPPRAIGFQLTPPAQAELTEIPLPARVRAVEGRVVDADGAGVAQALVWLLSGDEPRWTNTRADGAFRLDGLQRGPWDARVLAERRAPAKFVLQDGAPNVLRLVEAPRAAPGVPPLPRAHLAGTLLGTAQLDLEGAEIALEPVLAPESIEAPLPRRARSDAGGRFAFEDLIAGDYRVAVLPAWAAGGSWPDLARAEAAPLATPFTHSADGAAPLSIDLVAGSAVGVLLDGEGRALEGALVTLAPLARPERPWPPASTDVRGGFEFRGLPPGRYALEARAGGARATREFEVTARARIELGRLEAAARP